MIKCLECGFETDRLQWTHFKFKCTGKFNNSKEYKLAYPDAELVSKELSAKTAVTHRRLVEKYGEQVGTSRWNIYKEKQAKSNSFEYKQKKHGWTKEQYDHYNSSRAQTLSKMIERYGEYEGNLRWISYCERQAFTNCRTYYIEKYGQELGLQKFLHLNKQKSSAVNPELLSIKLGISLDEAVQIILSRTTNTGDVWGSNLEKEFTTMLIDKIGELEYSTFTRPYGKWSVLLGSYVIYDIKHLNYIIEFNGDYWHANPKIYKDECVIRGRTAAEIQEYDYKKLKTVEDLGFKTYTVWESDFKQDKHELIRKVVAWMQNGQP